MLLPLLWRRCGERRSMTLSPRRGRSAIATVIEEPPSPFLDPEARPVDPGKFRDPLVTAKDEPRAHVGLERLETLWINTGTLCNLTCKTCYIESSPTNEALVYLTLADAEGYRSEEHTSELQTLMRSSYAGL